MRLFTKSVYVWHTISEANNAYGNDTPCIHTSPGSWRYQDARLTRKGIKQCLKARGETMGGGAEHISPELIVVSPFTRTLQTAHIIFSGRNIPFLVHDTARERWGKYTCDKRRSKSEILRDIAPLFRASNDRIDVKSFAFGEDLDTKWTEERESFDSITGRGIELLKWLATRPEREIAVVTHGSFLRHLFHAFGSSLANKDQKHLHRKSGNCEVR
jgi:broad specificity phosphatase PhoE